MKVSEIEELLWQALTDEAHWRVNKRLVYAVGLDAALLLTNLVSKQYYFKSKKTLTREGFFFNTQKNITESLGMSPHTQRQVIRKLELIGILETRKMGIPAKTYFKVVNNKMLKILTTGALKFEAHNKYKRNKYFNINSYLTGKNSVEPGIKLPRIRTFNGEPILYVPPPIFDELMEVASLKNILIDLEYNYSKIGRPRDFWKFKFQPGSGFYKIALKIVTYLQTLRTGYVNPVKVLYRDYFTSIYDRYASRNTIPTFPQFSPSDTNRHHFEDIWLRDWQDDHQEPYWRMGKPKKRIKFDATGKRIK